MEETKSQVRSEIKQVKEKAEMKQQLYEKMTYKRDMAEERFKIAKGDFQRRYDEKVKKIIQLDKELELRSAYAKEQSQQIENLYHKLAQSSLNKQREHGDVLMRVSDLQSELSQLYA